MIVCGECLEVFKRAKHRLDHRKQVHPDSSGCSPGGFCAFCDDHACTLFDGLDHLVEEHIGEWLKMTDRFEQTYGQKIIHMPRRYTIAKAALSLTRARPSLEDVYKRIDNLSQEFEEDDEDEEEQEPPEKAKEVTDVGAREASVEEDEGHKQLQQHYENISPLVNRMPTSNPPPPHSPLLPPPPPPATVPHRMPVLKSAVNSAADGVERRDKVSRTAVPIDRTSSNDPPPPLHPP
ncbi:hypothetical protein PMAYCL1PPCAC_28246, partial [Pristionchus mayeri]